MSTIFTARKRSLGQGNVFTPVCDSIHKEGIVCPIAYWDTPAPGQTPPQVDTCWGRHPPGRHPLSDLWDAVNKRAVRILLGCILVNIICRLANLKNYEAIRGKVVADIGAGTGELESIHTNNEAKSIRVFSIFGSSNF